MTPGAPKPSTAHSCTTGLRRDRKGLAFHSSRSNGGGDGCRKLIGGPFSVLDSSRDYGRETAESIAGRVSRRRTSTRTSIRNRKRPRTGSPGRLHRRRSGRHEARGRGGG